MNLEANNSKKAGEEDRNINKRKRGEKDKLTQCY
jgi:hypothetical protein